MKYRLLLTGTCIPLAIGICVLLVAIAFDSAYCDLDHALMTFSIGLGLSIVAVLAYSIWIIIFDIISSWKNPDDSAVIYNRGARALHKGFCIKRSDIINAMRFFKKAASKDFKPAKRALAFFEGYGYSVND